jgi:hypothetical protein
MKEKAPTRRLSSRGLSSAQQLAGVDPAGIASACSL